MKFSDRLAKHHESMTEHHHAAGDAVEKENPELAKAHHAMGDEHSAMADACSKASRADDLEKLQPTGISRVAPTIPAARMVPRAGMPPIGGEAARVMDPRFQKILGTDQDSTDFLDKTVS